MKQEQFKLMLSLLSNIRVDANALFQEYQELYQKIVGCNQYGHSELKGQYSFYIPSNFMDDWNETLWDRMMEEYELEFREDLGYEGQYNSVSLPIRWLFNTNWKSEATAALIVKAEQYRIIQEKDRMKYEEQERATLLRLSAKYTQK